MLAPVTPINDVYRLDHAVQDATLINPNTVNSYEAGEFLTPNATTGRMERVGATPVADCYALFTERGDYTSQAIGKVTMLELGDYIADTDMFDDALTATVGLALSVHNATVGAVTRSVLTQAASGEFVHAVVIHPLPAGNSGLLRFRKITPYVLP